MPYASDKQRRFMHAKHPEIAKRWDAEESKKKKRPRSGSRTASAYILALKMAGKKVGKV